MNCKDTFGSLYDKLKTIQVEQLDIILTHMEKSCKSAQLDEDDIMEIMNSIYCSLIGDAFRKNKIDRLKYFLDKYYENESINAINFYTPSIIYIHVLEHKCGTDDLLPLFKFLIKQQIKNLKEHDDSDCEYYDINIHPAFIKYLYNIGYINENLANFFKQFDCNKLEI